MAHAVFLPGMPAEPDECKTWAVRRFGNVPEKIAGKYQEMSAGHKKVIGTTLFSGFYEK